MARKLIKLNELCPNGHLVTEDKAYIYPEGTKLAGRVVCKICRMNSNRKRKGIPTSDSIGVWNRNKTQCAKGHEYTEENTRIKPDGSRGCKTCHKRGTRERTYGIAWEEFESMWKSQKQRCAICSGKFNDQSEASVDHDHKTNKVRGLLCNNCNNGLGRFMDNIKYLEAAISYLKTH